MKLVARRPNKVSTGQWSSANNASLYHIKLDSCLTRLYIFVDFGETRYERPHARAADCRRGESWRDRSRHSQKVYYLCQSVSSDHTFKVMSVSSEVEDSKEYIHWSFVSAL